MRKMLNTLYIINPDAYVMRDGLNFVISVKQKEVMRIPAINLEGIITAGYSGASPGAMKLSVDQGVSMAFVTQSGRFIARVQGPVHGNILLRKRQYGLSESCDFSLKLSQTMIAGKIFNTKAILRRFIRDYGENPQIEKAIIKLRTCKNRALTSNDANALRGIEGEAAGVYFSVFDSLILHQKEFFRFRGRNRRPPKDAVNVLLSFLYTMLGNDVASALETVGLDPAMGFFHSLRPGRKSLALDLMEELRAYLADRMVLSLINRMQITPKDFINQGEGTLQLSEQGRKIIIKTWQERKKKELMHPFLKEKIPIGLLPYSQALLLARFLRGDLDAYPVYLIK